MIMDLMGIIIESPKISAIIGGLVLDKFVAITSFTKGDLIISLMRGAVRGATAAYRNTLVSSAGPKSGVGELPVSKHGHGQRS